MNIVDLGKLRWYSWYRKLVKENGIGGNKN
jgi:hypothetical protein